MNEEFFPFLWNHYNFKYDGSLNYEQWEKMLSVNDSKREWNLKGVHEGFEI